MGNTFKLGNYVNAIFQDASNNVGIGGSPSGSYKLEVTGTAKVSSTLLVSGSVTSDDLILTAGTLFGAGNTGFSNRSSDTTLYLQMPATGFNITDNALNTRFILSSAGAATFYSSVTAAGEYVNTSGNASRIFFSGTATTGYQYVNIKNTSASLLYGIEGNTSGNLATGDIAYSSGIYTGTATALHFGSNQVVGMTISSANRIGINETNPQDLVHIANGTLRIDGTAAQAIYIRGAAGIKNYITLNEFGVRQWDIAAGTYSVGTFSIQSNSINGVYLGGTATAWASASDENLKDIIEPIQNAVTKVNGLRSVIGKYKTDEEDVRRSFLIAQDIQTHFPEALESSNPDRLGVQYTDVIPLLVAAIKELSAQNQDLKSRLDKAGL